MKKLLLLCTLFLGLFSCSKDSSSVNSGGGTGKGGSLARFTIIGNYLYTIDGSNLSVFDITNGQAPLFKNKVNINRDIEALFPFKNKLFIASSSGMYIFSLSNPTMPIEESYVQHLTGCDPVVANDSMAFLTIHGGTRCNSTINQLQVYNIRNLSYPQFISSIDMTNPFGLGLKDSVLYVCDNGTGMRLYNVKNPYNIKPLSVETGETFVDVIPLDSTMVCMLTNGVAFYDISNPASIHKLSTVKN